MARCEVCGNDYDKAFEVVLNEQSHTFDSFECAIRALAPVLHPLWLQSNWARRRSRRQHFLLCSCAEHSGAVGTQDRVR